LKQNILQIHYIDHQLDFIYNVSDLINLTTSYSVSRIVPRFEDVTTTSIGGSVVGNAGCSDAAVTDGMDRYPLFFHSSTNDDNIVRNI
jgi:hypothetical protein